MPSVCQRQVDDSHRLANIPSTPALNCRLVGENNSPTALPISRVIVDDYIFDVSHIV